MKPTTKIHNVWLVVVDEVPIVAWADPYEAKHYAASVEHETGKLCLVVPATVEYDDCMV